MSVAFSKQAALEDCGWADLLIAKSPSDCKEGKVIDFFDVWREGHHAVWLSADKITVKTVEQARSKRPWTQTAAKNKN